MAAEQNQYADVVKKLEEIVKQLEKGDLPLEVSIERFSEGMALSKKAESILASAERRIDELVRDGASPTPVVDSEVGEPDLPF